MSRRDFNTPPGPVTHALVVGVGSYPYCGYDKPLPAAQAVIDLTSPPRSAHDFAHWLEAHSSELVTPLSSITMLTDPVGGSTRTVTAPTYDNVKDAMRKWQDGANKEDCLLLYWCGHGFEHEGNRLLLCQDVGKDGDFWDYAVNNSTDYLKSCASDASTQLWLIDACREAASGLKTFQPSGRSVLPDVAASYLELVQGKDLGLVLSSMSFQTASGRKHQASHFCKALIQALEWRGYVERDGEGWSVRTTDLVGPINSHLIEQGLNQHCHPGGGIGQHAVLSRSDPPDVRATLVCDPAAIQRYIKMQVQRFAPGSVLHHVARQDTPSVNPWEIPLRAGRFLLSGNDTRASNATSNDEITISPTKTRGVLTWL